MVVSGVAPHITVEPLTKFAPVTVSVNGALPAIAEEGLRDEIVGPLTMNAIAAEEAPPGFCTVRFNVPAAATRLAGMAAVMDVAVPAVTASAVVPA